MARFSAFLLPILALFFLCAESAPTGLAARGLSIGGIINALHIGFVKDINVIITLDSLTTNMVEVNFDAKNPLPIELTIDRVVSSAGLNGTVYATFDQTFAKPVVVPIFGTKNSGTFGNVSLVQGAIASLDIIPVGAMDLINADVYLRAATIFGKWGIPIPIKGLKQSNVTTTYNISLT